MTDRIVSDPKICGGEYCVRHTRIPVHVVFSHLAAGESYEDLLKNFPSLKKDDIYACLDFAGHVASEKIIAL